MNDRMVIHISERPAASDFSKDASHGDRAEHLEYALGVHARQLREIVPGECRNKSRRYYAADVLKTAAEKKLSNNQLIDILKASANIDSDHYLSEVLLSLSDQVRSSDSAVKDAYRSAAKNIDSDTYYGRAVKAID